MAGYELTSRVLLCRISGTDRRTVERDVVLLAYHYIRNNRTLDEDEACDFFSQNYSKFISLIDTFTFLGRPFEAYLFISIKWHMLHYHKTLQHRKLTENIYTLAQFGEVAQSEPLYTSPQLPEWKKTQSSPDAINRRRFIYLALRESEYLNHAMIEEVIAYTRVDRRWFLNCVMALREKMEQRRKKLIQYRLYYNRCFFQYHSFQFQLQHCVDVERRQILQDKLSVLEARMKSANRKLRNLHIHPTNQEISDVLNVPKGTIDSGIYYLKQSFFESEKKKTA